MSIVCLACCTTGLPKNSRQTPSRRLADYDCARLIGIEAVRTGLEGTVEDEFFVIVSLPDSPSIPNPEFHGITPELVATDGLPLAECLTRLRDFVGERPIYAHSASFHESVLEAECRRAGLRPALPPMQCTMTCQHATQTSAVGGRGGGLQPKYPTLAELAAAHQTSIVYDEPCARTRCLARVLKAMSTG